MLWIVKCYNSWPCTVTASNVVHTDRHIISHHHSLSINSNQTWGHNLFASATLSFITWIVQSLSLPSPWPPWEFYGEPQARLYTSASIILRSNSSPPQQPPSPCPSATPSGSFYGTSLKPWLVPNGCRGIACTNLRCWILDKSLFDDGLCTEDEICVCVYIFMCVCIS